MTNSGPGAVPSRRPLFVDLDGTLVQTDLLYEAFLHRLKHDWALPLRAFAWLARGRAALKTRLADGRVVGVDTLPYQPAVLELIRAARADGRQVFLATASHLGLATQVADHLGLFDGVIATVPGSNVSAASKLAHVRAMTRADDFEYLGNSGADIPVWEASARAGVVAPDFAARRWLGQHPDKAHAVGVQSSVGAAWMARLRLLRPRRWLENLPLGLPIVAAGRWPDPGSDARLALAFVAFGLWSSAANIIDEMLQVEADRQHPCRRDRPFASGAVALSFGFQLAAALVFTAMLVGVAVSAAFTAVLAACALIDLACSLSLERGRGGRVAMRAVRHLLCIAGGTVAIDAWF